MNIFNPKGEKLFYDLSYSPERSAFNLPHDYNSYYEFFNKKTFKFISDSITHRLKGVHPQNLNIIVDDDQILSVMDSIYRNESKDVHKMIMMSIMYIVEYIKNEYAVEQKNNNYSAWSTDFRPELNIQRVPNIKLRTKKLNSSFNYNY